MLPTEYRFSSRYLLVVLYLALLTLLSLLLKWEIDKAAPPISVSSRQVSLADQQSKIAVSGHGFHEQLNAVTAQALVHDQALLWRLLENVPTTEVAVKGDLLMVASAERGKVLSIKISQNGPSGFLDSIQFPEGISRISIVGDKALICLQRHAGVAVVDVKDPANLSLVSMLSETGIVSDMLTSGSRVYFADIYRGLGRFDMSGTVTQVVPLAQMDSPWRLTMLDGRLVVGTLKGKVYLFDILADGDVHEVGVLEFPTNVRGVVMTGQTLSVALADGTLHTYEMSLWPALKKVGTLLLPGSPLSLERLDGSSKMLASFVSGGISIIDFKNPSSPVFSGHLRVAKTFRGLTAQDGVVYGGSRDGLEAFSVAGIENGMFSSLIEGAVISREFLKFKLWNGKVAGYANGHPSIVAESASGSGTESKYLAVNEDDTVSLFELQDNQHFRKLGYQVRINGVRDTAILNGNLYILHRDGLQVRSFSGKEQLEVVAELPLSGSVRAFKPLGETTVLVATRDAGVHFVDITNPANPQLTSTLAPEKHLQTANIAYDFLVDGNRVYVSYGSGGIYVLDVSNRRSPRIIQKISTLENAKKMAMVDGLLLIADGPDGLFLVDTDTYDVAVPVGRLPMPIRVDDMAVADGMLLVSSHPAGTMKLPLPRRARGVEALSSEELRVPVQAYETAQFLYLYDERGSGEVRIAPKNM